MIKERTVQIKEEQHVSIAKRANRNGSQVKQVVPIVKLVEPMRKSKVQQRMLV